MLKVIMRLAVITGIVVAVLGTLFSLADLPNQKNNGFVRKWLADSALDSNEEFDIEEPVTKIAGIVDSIIYLTADNPNATLLLSRSFKYKDTLLMNYQMPPEKMLPFAMIIDSPYMYWHFYNMKSVISGVIAGGKLRLSTINTPLFIRSVQISNPTIVVKGFDSTMTKQVFKKINIETGSTEVEKDILINMRDGSLGTSTDGVMHYNKQKNLILYVEYFSNRIYCLDSNLNLIYRSNTIDTVQNSSMALSIEKNKDTTGKIAPEKARSMVNKDIFSNSNYLFVVSAMRADNQTIADYNKHVVIDVYFLTDGSYLGSIKVKKINEKGFGSAIIHNGQLLALYGTKLCIFKLPAIYN